jgi:8-oxo-dGTP pyrophosphatase MutT (NUDIX family)
MGAGILPISSINGRLFFLFGKEAESHLWSDFGGGKENNESDFETAIREGSEELNGFLGSGENLRKMVETNNILTIHYEKYKIFLFIIKYDRNLPIYFKNNYEFIKNSHLFKEVKKNDGLFEKEEIKWFCLKDMEKQSKNFRMFYRPILKIIMREYDTLLDKIVEYKNFN